MTWLDDIEARLAAAAPGPWSAEEGDTDAIEIRDANDRLVWFDVLHEDDWTNARQRRDLCVIANAPADLRRLLRVARAAEAELAALDVIATNMRRHVTRGDVAAATHTERKARDELRVALAEEPR